MVLIRVCSKSVYYCKNKYPLRIDTSGGSTNVGALFNKVWMSWSLGEYYVLYLIR